MKQCCSWFVNNCKLLIDTTALHIACDKNNLSMVKLFLENGANPSQVETKRRECTTLHLAAIHGNLKMMQLLISNGFDLGQLVNKEATIESTTSINFMSVFLILCHGGNVECLEYLLSVCTFVDIEATDFFRRTGMGLAIVSKHRLMLKHLITKVYSKESIVLELVRMIHGGAGVSCEMLLEAATQPKLVKFALINFFLRFVLSCYISDD